MKPEPWQQPTSRSCREYAFITLNRLSCPSPSFSLKKSCSGYVRAMSRRITFSHAEVALIQSAYCFLTGESCAPQSSCHTIPRKWCGTPFRTRSCTERHSDQLNTSHKNSPMRTSKCLQLLSTTTHKSTSSFLPRIVFLLQWTGFQMWCWRRMEFSWTDHGEKK